jgi:hypothetical protein
MYVEIIVEIFTIKLHSEVLHFTWLQLEKGVLQYPCNRKDYGIEELESQKNFIYLLHQNVCPESPDIYLEH